MGTNNSSEICIDSSDFNLIKHYKSSKFKSIKSSMHQLNQSTSDQFSINQHNISSDQFNINQTETDKIDKNDHIDQYDQIKDPTYADIYHNIIIARQLIKERKKNKYTRKHKYTTDIVDIGVPKKIKKKNGLCDTKYTMKLSKK